MDSGDRTANPPRRNCEHTKLGLLDSENIPMEASPAVVDVPPKDGLPAGRFTLVNNPGLLQLAGFKGKVEPYWHESVDSCEHYIYTIQNGRIKRGPLACASRQLSATRQVIVNFIYMFIVVKRLGRLIAVVKVIVIAVVTVVLVATIVVGWDLIRVQLETMLVASLFFNTIASHTTSSDISCIERVGDNKGVRPAIRNGVPLERRCS